jgi:hypothetical protein
MTSKNKWIDPTSYEPIKPNAGQESKIQVMRAAARAFAETMDRVVPAGPDKTHTFRQFRTVMMWANYAISRGADDAREDDQDGGKEAS